VITQRLRLRLRPTTLSRIINLQRRNWVVRVRGQNAAGTWLKVNTFKGEWGWVYANYVDVIIGDVDNVPVLTK
jgi:hypothetical protein